MPVICDFCLGPGVQWEYPVAPVTLPSHPVYTASADEFAACEACRRLIDAGDVDGLVDRVVQMQPVHVPAGTITDDGLVVYGPEANRRRDARLTVNLFFAAKEGPARRYRP